MAPLTKAKRKSYLPKTADGKIKAGPGRTKGVPNKITREAKHAIALAFEGIGGQDALIEWAKKTDTNRMIFYTQLYTKLIPLQVQGKLDVNHENNDGEYFNKLHAALSGIIAARRNGDSATPVVIDAEPNGSAVPQLVSSRKTG